MWLGFLSDLVVMLFPPGIRKTCFAASVLQCLLSQKQLNNLLISVLSNHQSSDCKPWEYRVVFLQEHLFVLKKYCTSMLWFIYVYLFLFICLFIYYLFVYLFYLFIKLFIYLFIILFIMYDEKVSLLQKFQFSLHVVTILGYKSWFTRSTF